MKVQFIGDGGHAKVLRDMCHLLGIEITDKHDERFPIPYVIAYGGITCEALEKRYNDAEAIAGSKCFPDLYHPSAVMKDIFARGKGCHVMANAVFMGERLRDFSIINTGAIVEHGTEIGYGCHIAPGAIVLGDCKVGDFCMIGAGAIIIQGSTVPDRTFVKAGAIWNKK